MSGTPPSFSLIPGSTVRDVLDGHRNQVLETVREAYRLHDAGSSVNPDSYFLRFPQNPSSRIIALPAFLGEQFDVAGIKWISSFPQNIETGLPRASAVLILNDMATGYPYACMEASLISAARTAASAALGAARLDGNRRQAGRVAVIGAGIIARTILDYLEADGWALGDICIFDHEPEYSEALRAYCARCGYGEESRVAPTAEEAVRGSDLVVLATTAAQPWLTEHRLLEHAPIVLNISLRDIGPEIILESFNIVDDVEHCMKANTSPHLAEQQTGHRDFIAGTLAALDAGNIEVPEKVTRIFSPFGLGVLDLAVGHTVHSIAKRTGRLIEIDEFFGGSTRW